jgi:hypothetical protein
MRLTGASRGLRRLALLEARQCRLEGRGKYIHFLQPNSLERQRGISFPAIIRAMSRNDAKIETLERQLSAKGTPLVSRRLSTFWGRFAIPLMQWIRPKGKAVRSLFLVKPSVAG